MIFLVLNLNAVMSVIAAVPSAVVSAVSALFSFTDAQTLIDTQIVACRVVRRLSNYTNKGPEMFTYVIGHDRIGLTSDGFVLVPHKDPHSSFTLDSVVLTSR